MWRISEDKSSNIQIVSLYMIYRTMAEMNITKKRKGPMQALYSTTNQKINIKNCHVKWGRNETDTPSCFQSSAKPALAGSR